MLGARVGVRARVDQHGRPLRRRGSRSRSRAGGRPGGAGRGAGTPRATAPVFPAETTAVRLAVADRADGANERRVGLGPHRLGGLLVHRDRLGRGHELQPVGVERPPARRGRARSWSEAACDGAGDDLVRCVVAAEGVDGDANARPAGRMASTGPCGRGKPRLTARGPAAAGPRGRDTSCTSGRRGATASASRSSRRSRRAARRSRAGRGACRGGPSRSFASGRP